MESIENDNNDTARKVTFKLTSLQAKEEISLYFPDKHRILSACLNDKNIPIETNKNPWWHWGYYGLPEKGIEITLTIEGDQKLDLKIFAVNWGLPQTLLTKIPPRPENTMPRFYTYSDAMVLFNQFKL